MARLPSSFREKNRTTRNYRDQYAKLPQHIKDAVRDACVIFDRDPRHPSLRHHDLGETKRGQHYPASASVSVTMQYRAIYLVQDGINVWYWIGTHNEYENFTGKK